MGSNTVSGYGSNAPSPNAFQPFPSLVAKTISGFVNSWKTVRCVCMRVVFPDASRAMRPRGFHIASGTPGGQHL
eukprot:2835188-Lingulodinium_polyedra.AAC.1